MLYKARNEAVNFFDEYSSMVSEAKNGAKNKTSGIGLKILTPKQLLQRLPMALAQVKAGNNFVKRNQTNRLFFVSIKRNH